MFWFAGGSESVPEDALHRALSDSIAVARQVFDTLTEFVQVRPDRLHSRAARWADV